jgi:hypothetical protein
MSLRVIASLSLAAYSAAAAALLSGERAGRLVQRMARLRARSISSATVGGAAGSRRSLV